MPSRIRVLPDHVANQIAAGEVVERPASVIKELVENGVDAGAVSVTVSFRDGGKSFIEVSDDGCGMERDDAILSLERHATSKIRDAASLSQVNTLGFRGEALPSIASVSRFLMSTATPNAAEGVEINVEGGSIREVRAGAPLPGTRIQVRSLFYNIPARRKFMRSEGVEAGHAQEAVIRQALGKPEINFTLIRDGAPVFQAKGSKEPDALFRRIESLFGRDTASALIPVDHTFAGMRVRGFVSRPGSTRSSADHQYYFINGRYIRDRMIHYALMEAFRSLLPRGRHPMAFLWLAMPPGRVDVNVSPTKTEARFADGGSVIGLVKNGVERALESARTGRPMEPVFTAPMDDLPLSPEPLTAPAPRALAEPVAALEPPAWEAAAGQTAPPVPRMEVETWISDAAVPLGQAFNTFIIFEDGDRLILLDQHTAHERVNYERLMTRAREGKVDAQELLFPLTLDLSRRDADLARRHREDFERLGLVMDEMGPQSFTLRSAPAILAGKNLAGLAADILDRIASVGDAGGFDRLAEEAVTVMACRGAVKAGDRLDRREIESLTRQLAQCRMPYTCPHGRPIALTLRKEDLYKGFLRT